MKKILFMAMTAIVLMACGDGNDPSNENFDGPFAISVDELGSPNHARITITPSDKEVWYFCFVEKEEKFFRNGGSAKEILNNRFQSQKKTYKDKGKTFEDYLNELKNNANQNEYKKGDFVRVENSLEEGTDYIVLVCVVNTNAKIVGDVVSKRFATGI